MDALTCLSAEIDAGHHLLADPQEDGTFNVWVEYGGGCGTSLSPYEGVTAEELEQVPARHVYFRG